MHTLGSYWCAESDSLDEYYTNSIKTSDLHYGHGLNPCLEAVSDDVCLSWN